MVRSTGHDFAGKGIGAGALSLWTHNLNDLQFFPSYTYGSYSGPAFKLGAGVMTEDVYALAEANGVTAVGGECRVSKLAVLVDNSKLMTLKDCRHGWRVYCWWWTFSNVESGRNGSGSGNL